MLLLLMFMLFSLLHNRIVDIFFCLRALTSASHFDLGLISTNPVLTIPYSLNSPVRMLILAYPRTFRSIFSLNFTRFRGFLLEIVNDALLRLSG